MQKVAAAQRRHGRSIVAGLAVALAWVLLPVEAVGQTSPCDPAIERNARRGQLGYQSRGEHCEGLYETDVAALPIWVASLTQVFSPYDLNSTDPLVISWEPPAGDGLNLRAHGIKRNLYYRMDAPGRAGGAFEWSTDVLAAQGIERDDIGVLGWSTHSSDGAQHNVLVPVRVAQGGREAGTGTEGYELVLVPNVRLNEVFVTLAAVSGPGEYPQGSYIKDREPLGQVVYATQQPIRAHLTGFDAPGPEKRPAPARCGPFPACAARFVYRHCPSGRVLIHR